MADMDVTAKFRADISDMKSKMDTISRSVEGLNQSAKNASGGFTVLKGALGTAFGGAIIGGVFAAGKALGALAADSVNAASTMEELSTKVDAIFGSAAAAEIQAWSETASSAFGQSQISAQNAASTFAIFGKGAGLAGSDLVGFSTGLTELSSDLASFYDASPEEAITAIGAALRGETEPIRRFGVLLDDASLRQEAFAQGLISTTKDALNPQQRVLAAQSLIMKQTADAQGDFARTSDGLANSQRTLAAVIEDVKATVGTALLPAITAIVQAIGPAVQQISGPLSQIAELVGTFVADAFAQLAPLLPPLMEALLAIGQVVSQALVTALSALLPSLLPVIEALASLAQQIAPILAQVLGKVGELLGKLVGAVAPLIPPLTNLIFSILDAAAPILTLVADLLLVLVDALTPVLDAVLALISPLIELVSVALSAIMPVLKPILPIFELLAKIIGDILVRAVGLIMLALGQLISGLSKVVGFVLRNVAPPIMKAFLDMAKGVVGAAARMLGWVPGLGDKLVEAENAIGEFANNIEGTMKEVADTAETEGARIGNGMITAGQQALVNGAPALGNTARQTGAYVAGQYNSALTHGMGHPQLGTTGPKPAPAPAAPPPPTGPGGGGGGGGKSGTGKSADEDSKAVDRLLEKLDKWKQAAEKVRDASQRLYDATRVLPPELAHLGDTIGGLVQTEIQQMFGPGGTIQGVISGFKDLGQNIDDFYKPLLNVELFGKKAVRAARSAMNSAKDFLKTSTETAVRLMAQRDRINKALSDLETEYQQGVAAINSRYDALDKAAAAATAALEKSWDGIIKGLESALDSANKAFEKENAVLQNLISERDSFLGSIRSGFRSFLNNLSFESSQATKQIIKETKKLANGITVTLEREIEVGGGAANIRQQLESRLAVIREFSKNIRTLIGRGLDPTLVQEFVAAGVDGAGEAVKALTQASSADLAAINSAQRGLASEVADFQKYASQQWFDAGIAQQEAIVAPLRTAAQAAQASLDAANLLREQELTAARAHQEQLKLDREAALAAELLNYNQRKEVLQQEGKDVEAALTANAQAVNDRLSSLQETLPPKMQDAGRMAIDGLLRGLKKNKHKALGEARAIANEIKAIFAEAFAMRSPSRVMEEMGENIAKGLAIGMRDGTRDVLMQARSMSNAAMPPMPPMGGSSGGTVINIQITAPALTDPAEVGRQAVEAIRKYERRSGPVFVSAS